MKLSGTVSSNVNITLEDEPLSEDYLLAVWVVFLPHNSCFLSYLPGHRFIEMFKILKFREPRELFEKLLISSNNRNNRMVLNPNNKNNKLPATEQNFLFKSCIIWNTLLRSFLKRIKSILIEVISSLEKRKTLTSQRQ